MAPWRQLYQLGREQRGVVAARQAVELGIPRTSFDARIMREGWQRPFRGVVCLPGVVIDHETIARAAALCIGGRATITGASALYLRGCLDRPPARAQLVVPVQQRPSKLPGVRIVSSRTLAAAHHERNAGAWLATVPRACLDGARFVDQAQLRIWLIDARQRRKVDIDDVMTLALSTPTTSGRGRLLAACSDVQRSGADSVLVAEVEQRLRAAGFIIDVPARVVQVPGRLLHPDITIVGLPVGLEVDGFGSHSERHALDLDQRKHNAYTLAGWTVLRIGWNRVESDWAGFLAEVTAAVSAARSQVLAAQAQAAVNGRGNTVRP